MYYVQKKYIFDPHSQDVILCKNTPIISKINNIELEIVNNEQFTIDKVSEEYIYISNADKQVQIEVKDFQQLIYVAYCITIHSSQGETFDGNYTIHDWDKLNKHLRYVALTRSSNISYINVV